MKRKKEQGNCQFQIEGRQFDRLNEVCGHSIDAMNVFLTACIACLFSIYNQSTQVKVETENSEEEARILVIPVKPECTVRDYLHQVKEDFIHKSNSREDENEDSNVLVLVRQEAKELKDIRLVRNHIGYCFDVSKDSIALNVCYSAYMWDAYQVSIQVMLFRQIMEDFLWNPDNALCKLSFSQMTEGLENRGYHKEDYPKGITLAEVFKRSAAKYSNRIAVFQNDRTLTYQELDELSEAICELLVKKGIKKQDPVGIQFERSLELAAVVIGVLKAGGICIPLDTRYPKRRVENILEDSKAVALLNQTGDGKAGLEGITIRLMDTRDNSTLYWDPDGTGKTAFYIYTSGSEGKPKGVALSHQGILNHTYSKIRDIEMNQDDIMCYSLSPGFVASIWQLFAPLCVGASLYVCTVDEMISPYSLFKTVKENHISVLEIVPSVLESYLRQLKQGAKPQQIDCLKMLILTGEEVKAGLVKRFYQQYHVPLMNAYGQSECSDDTLHYKIPYEFSGQKVPIGKPVGNTRVYILGAKESMVPEGALGEICIAGAGLSLGYVGNQELSEQKFVQNPYQPEERLYHTGDFGRWTQEGVIEYMGRCDRQIKLRGFRIETGEIEEKLMECKSVKEAVVLKKNLNGRDSLCAYVVMDDDSITIEELKQRLENELPWYMVPANLVKVSQIQKTMNGKVDFRSFPEPGRSSEQKPLIPEKEMKEILTGIWSEVLNVKGACVTDNFFDAGGNSLVAAEMVMSIENRLGISISITDIFSSPTIYLLSERLTDIKKHRKKLYRQAVRKTEYALSPAQKRLYILNAYGAQDGKSLDAYNVEYEVEITGALNVDKLKKAFEDLVKRHDILRTTFHLKDGTLIQKVHDETKIDFVYQDLSRWSGQGNPGSDRCLFDLEHGPLICVRVYKVKEDKYIFHLRMSHLITDGYSVYILMRELEALYQCKELTEPGLQYQDYISWQELFLQGKEFKKQEEYWREQFKDGLKELDLPLDYQREQKQNFDGRAIFFDIDGKRVETIRKLERENDVSCFMVLYSIFLILLEKYTGSNDIVIGTVSSGRYSEEWYKVPGMFVNTLPVRTKFAGSDTCKMVLQKVKDGILNALDNQTYPFELLAEKLEKYHDMRKNSVFDTMFIMQNEVLEMNEFAGLQVKPCGTRIEGAKCDLTMNAYVSEGAIHMGLNYCTRLFREETIKKFAESYLRILDAMVNTVVKVDDINIVSDNEREQLITLGSKVAEHPEDKLLTEVFDEAAKNYPERTAVYDERASITYRELLKLSDKISFVLKRELEGKQVPIAVCLERSIEFVAAVLGVLKAGCRCIPLDIRNSKLRIKEILENSKAQALLTQKGTLLDTWGTIIPILEDKLVLSCEHVSSGSDRNKEYSRTTQNVRGHTNEAAFYIYSCDSSEKQTGVVLSHRGVLNHVFAKISDIGINEQDKVCFSLSTGYVASLWQVFASLYVGGSLYICTRKELEDPYELFKAVERENISVLEVIPSMLECYLKQLEQGALQRELKILKVIVLTGGEVKGGLIKRFYRRYHISLMNAYGLSECSDSTLHYRIPYEFSGGRVPVGRPVANTQVYIMGQRGDIVPVGVKGEICISGDGLALSYVEDKIFTEQKFIENPLRAGQKLYKTGDYGRWTQQGVIEFLGRREQQVKIKGFLIEPGEIEEKLMELCEVSEAAVLKKQVDGREFLCAYVVLGDSECQIETIKRRLGRELPWYMIPAHIMAVTNIPKTMNGKIDRKRLPEPDKEVLSKQVQQAGKTEEILARIWREVLNTDEAGVTENFFELGGNSLVAAELTMKIQKELKKNVPIREIMKGMSIKEVSDYLIKQKS